MIGVGNAARRDDGVGPAVAAAVAVGPDIAVVTCPAEPTAILEAWAGTALAVVVDAAVGVPPGRVCVGSIDDIAAPEKPFSSHDLSLRHTSELGRALGRAPDELVVVSIGISDAGHGFGFSPVVAAALPEAVRTVERLLGEQTHEPDDQQP